MNQAGIIAAGLGKRLQSAYPGLPKPLVPVAGRPLCHWTAEALCAAGATNILIAHNSAGRAIRDSVSSAFTAVQWSFLEADTASSWETFRLVCSALSRAADNFIVSTVDALIPPHEARRFATAAAKSGADAALALTTFVDDEKPLWAEVDGTGLVRSLGEDVPRTQRALVTCGLYYLTCETAAAMPTAAAHPSLRAYLASLARSGRRVAGIPVSNTLDVDRPEDVTAAERFLQTSTGDSKKEAAAPW